MRINTLYYIIVFNLFLLPAGMGQQVIMSNEINYRTNDGIFLMGEIQDTILLFKERSYKYAVDVFNKDLEFLFEKELFFEKQKIHVNALLPGQKDFTLIYSYESKFKLYLKAVKYDLRGNPLDTALLYEEKEFLVDENFSHVLSEDEKKLLLFRETRYNSMEMIFFDLELHKKIWEKEMDFGNFRINYDLNGILVDDTGKIITAFEKNNISFKRKKHFHKIFIIDPYEDKISSLKIPFKGKVSVSFNFDIDRVNQEIVIAGLFSEKSNSRAEGHYLYKINQAQVTQDISFAEFSYDLLQIHKGNKRNPRKYIPDLRVKDLIIRRDGGLMMIAEMQKEVPRENIRRRYIDYHFEDMLVLAIHPDGELFWDDLIRKYQISYDDDAMYSSYFLFESPSKMRIIFNDEIKNENTISQYEFNPLGKGFRKSLFSTDLHHIKLIFEEAIQTSSTSLLVPSRYNNKYRIIKIEY